jgi:hypothetical protein
LANGTYLRTGGFFTAIGKHGTAIAPITVKGNTNTILTTGTDSTSNGIWIKGNNYWVLDGFSINTAKKGVMIDSSKYVSIRNLNIRKIGEEGIHLRKYSSYDTISNCFLDSIGMHTPGFGEGIYIGSAVSNWCTYTNCDIDTCNYNIVKNNSFGSLVRAENIDIKEGTKYNWVHHNNFNGAGLGNYNSADSWMDVKGNYNMIENNTGVNTMQDAFQIHVVYAGNGNYNVFKNNTGSVSAPGYAVYCQISGAAGTTVGNTICTNNIISGASAGISNIATVSCGTLLPVELSSFDLNKCNEDICIHWTTSSEINCEKFVVKRSYNGIDFEEISQKECTVFSKVERSYLVEDQVYNHYKSVLYYALYQKDINGKPVLMKTKSILNSIHDFEVTIGNKELIIHSDKERILQIQMYNYVGMKLKNFDLNITKGENKFELSDYEFINGRILKIIGNGSCKVVRYR